MNRRSFIQVATAALAAIGIRQSLARAESPEVKPKARPRPVGSRPPMEICGTLRLHAKVPVYSIEEQIDNGLRPMFNAGDWKPAYYSQGMMTYRITVVVPAFAVPRGMESTLDDIFHDAPPSRCVAESISFMADALSTLTYQIVAMPEHSKTITIRRIRE